MSDERPSAITGDEFLSILRASMPTANDLHLTVLDLSHGRAKVRMGYDPRTIRAGGSVAGPTVFALADLALYAVTMSVVGASTLTVTTDLTIHFLGKARGEALVADACIVRAGKLLVVGAVDIATESGSAVAHAVGTYAVPPAREDEGARS